MLGAPSDVAARDADGDDARPRHAERQDVACGGTEVERGATNELRRGHRRRTRFRQRNNRRRGAAERMGAADGVFGEEDDAGREQRPRYWSPKNPRGSRRPRQGNAIFEHSGAKVDDGGMRTLGHSDAGGLELPAPLVSAPAAARHRAPPGLSNPFLSPPPPRALIALLRRWPARGIRASAPILNTPRAGPHA